MVTANPAWDAPALQRDDERVQDKRSEPPDQHQEHHIPQPVKQLPDEIDRDDDRHRDEDRTERHRPEIGPPEDAWARLDVVSRGKG